MKKSWKDTKKRLMTGMLVAAGTGMLLSGCGKKEEEVQEPPKPQTIVEDTEPDEETLLDEETVVEEEEEADTHEGEEIGRASCRERV